MTSEKEQILPDRPCRPGRILLIGINPSPISVEQGHYYRGRLGVRLWSRLQGLGILKDATRGHEDDAFVWAGNGLTDLVKRATRSASELTGAELSAGTEALKSKMLQWQPGLLLFQFRPPAVRLLGSDVR